MLKKIQLHWQILIALILAIIYGLIFSTTYTFTDKSFNKFAKRNINEEVVGKLKELQGNVYESRKEFIESIKSHIGEANYDKYKRLIIEQAYHNPAINGVSWMGDIFLKLLKMLIIPLILSSLISGITNIGSGSNLGRLGFKTISYYITTSILAIVTGLLLVNLFRPGIGADLSFEEKVAGLLEKQRTFKEIIIDIVPNNVFHAFAEGDMLSIIFFALLFGFFIMKVAPRSKQLLSDAFNAIFEVMMKITLFVIKFTPLGIFGIVCKVIADQDDLTALVTRMGLYMGTVVLALGIHFVVILPLLMRFIGKANPWAHFRNMSIPLLTAFSTSSSGATLPLTMNAVEKNSGVSNKISSFTLPLGATINMDGTALYECIAAMFIAQAYGVELTLVHQIIVIFTALLASIGAAAIPMAGLVMITVILSAVGLPLEGVGLILAVDRILDMFRTCTNVWSDSCGSVIIAKSEGEKLNV